MPQETIFLEYSYREIQKELNSLAKLKELQFRSFEEIDSAVRGSVIGPKSRPRIINEVKKASKESKLIIVEMGFLERNYSHHKKKAFSGNFVTLGILASRLVEIEIAKKITNPSLSISSEILNAMKDYKKNYPVQSIEDFYSGKHGSTMGISIMILCGIRWALKKESKPVIDFLLKNFESEYQHILKDNSFTKSLEFIKSSYRDPLSHWKVTISKKELSEILSYTIGTESIVDWVKKPLSPSPIDRGCVNNTLFFAK